MAKAPGKLRIAAVADLHFGRDGYGPPLRPLFDDLGERADVLALCGDLTDRGDPEEARGLARVLAGTTIPTVAVFGNHDYESGQTTELSKILCDAGVHVLDGGSYEVRGVGFAGVKGFAGGFGRRALGGRRSLPCLCAGRRPFSCRESRGLHPERPARRRPAGRG